MKLFRFIAITLIGGFLLASCQGKYHDAGPGQSAVITKGAGFRAEGGGLLDTVFFIGTHKIAGPWTNVNITTVESGPRMLWMDDLGVVIPSMQNQQVKVDAGIVIMPNPAHIASLSSRMPKWDSKVYTSFETVTKKIVQAETKGLDLNSTDAVNQANAIAKTEGFREALGKKILAGTVREFNENNPGFDSDFFFIYVVVGDVTYPQYITDGFAKVSQADYKLKREKIKRDHEILQEELEAQDLESDLQAYAREGGVMSKKLLKFKSMDNLFEILKNQDATVIMRVNSDGSIDWFNQ